MSSDPILNLLMICKHSRHCYIQIKISMFHDSKAGETHREADFTESGGNGEQGDASELVVLRPDPVWDTAECVWLRGSALDGIQQCVWF